MSRILIASPPVARGLRHYDRAFMPFLGMGYLAAHMRAQGHHVRVADSHLGKTDLTSLLRAARQFQPDVVGLSAMTHEIPQAYQAARAIRQAVPAARVALGGPHANARPCETLRECEALDVVCFGEGEHTFAELAERWAGGDRVDDCPGVASHGPAGEPREAPRRPWLQDLDALEFPAWDLFPPSDVYPIMSARGCPFRCNFCCRAMGDAVRARSAANTVDEIEWVVKTFRPRLIRFEDETLSWHRGHIHEILDLILSRGLERSVEFSGQTRVDRVDRELFHTLKRANFRTVEMGVESGSAAILAASGKRIDVEKVRDSFAAAHEAGLRTWAKFILGHPHETPDTLRETVDLAAAVNATIVSFAIMVPYPGTEIWEMAARGEGGYRLIQRDWSAFDKFLGNALALDRLSRSALERWQIRAYATVYLRNRRYAEFARLLWTQRRMAAALAGKLLLSAISAPPAEGDRNSVDSPGTCTQAGGSRTAGPGTSPARCDRSPAAGDP